MCCWIALWPYNRSDGRFNLNKTLVWIDCDLQCKPLSFAKITVLLASTTGIDRHSTLFLKQASCLLERFLIWDFMAKQFHIQEAFDGILGQTFNFGVLLSKKNLLITVRCEVVSGDAFQTIQTTLLILFANQQPIKSCRLGEGNSQHRNHPEITIE